MSAPPQHTHSIPLYPDPVAHYLGPSPRFLCRVRYPTTRGHYRDWPCLLATETTISILPPRVRQTLRVQVQPLNGWSGRPVPDWCGIPCTIGYVSMIFPAQPAATPLNLGTWVRVPTAAADWMPDYLLLGSQFLRRFRIEVRLSLSGPVYYGSRYGHACGKLLVP